MLTTCACAESGVILESEFMLVDANDTPYARLFVRLCLASDFKVSA